MRKTRHKGWEKWDKLSKKLDSHKKKYAEDAWKEVTNIFGKNFNNNPTLRLACLSYVDSVGLATSLHLACVIDNRKKKRVK